MTLTQKIKRFALDEAGFDLAGVSRAELPAFHAEALGRWVEQGRAGVMDYMKRDPARRADPRKVLASARSVIALAVNYHHPEDPKPASPTGKVAQYAYGADYHDVLDKKLAKLAAFVREAGGPGTEARTYVDTGPVLEKAFAREAGLGFFGKNTNVITREFGSWVFLASVLTNLELEPDAPHAGSCGSCRLCLDACPTEALTAPYELDATRCISYWTIEAKEAAPRELARKFGDWVFGCDICQDVCPYNFRAKTTRHEELYPARRAGTWIGLDEAAEASEERFREKFRGSPVKRAKLAGLRRNAGTAAANRGLDHVR